MFNAKRARVSELAPTGLLLELVRDDVAHNSASETGFDFARNSSINLAVLLKAPVTLGWQLKPGKDRRVHIDTKRAEAGERATKRKYRQSAEVEELKDIPTVEQLVVGVHAHAPSRLTRARRTTTTGKSGTGS